jgi:hypothetical protein
MKNLFCVVCSLVFFPAFATGLPLRSLPDDSGLRAELKDRWLAASPAAVAALSPLIRTLPAGGEVQIRVEGRAADFTVVFARRLASGYPGWAEGSWAFTRDRRSGDPRHIRIFPRSDPYIYLQLRPGEFDQAKTLLDVVVYDAFIQRGIPLPLSFDRALTASLSEIIALAGDRNPLRYIETPPDDYRDVRSFIAKVREHINEVEFGDDGAIDENGEYVFIATLERQEDRGLGLGDEGTHGVNCSGFAKWLIDGILRPMTGKALSINELKAPFGDRGTGLNRPWEPVRDPYFGLDWTRNLAAAVQSARYAHTGWGTGTATEIPLEEFEVRRAPFTQVISRKGTASEIRSYPAHITDTGFASEGLHALLYTLAIDEPGNIYLASINDDRGGPRPRIRRHFHVAALVPYFDPNGAFHVAVFESAEETSFARFKTRYPGAFINLTRVPVEGDFQPNNR